MKTREGKRKEIGISVSLFMKVLSTLVLKFVEYRLEDEKCYTPTSLFL